MFDKFVPKKMKSLSTVTLGELSNTGWVVDFFSITVRMGFWGKKIQNEITTTPNYFKNLID
jgi:hypothetical protein